MQTNTKHQNPQKQPVIADIWANLLDDDADLSFLDTPLPSRPVANIATSRFSGLVSEEKIKEILDRPERTFDIRTGRLVEKEKKLSVSEVIDETEELIAHEIDIQNCEIDNFSLTQEI
ncbi:hypothetical protein LJC19_04850 [Oxalobacter sp. OttesenSCG-928-P03]|nr:hypothetical protein [Oxalobacter sp. OttesenSCG-928-P03]